MAASSSLHSTRLLGAAWALFALGAAMLAAGYEAIPEQVVLYRAPWSEAALTGAKSLFTVARVPLMGAGQVGAATAMVWASRQAPAWQRFWAWLGLAAGAKTLLECLTLLVPAGSLSASLFTAGTLGVVVAFLLAAAWWWKKGELREHPKLQGAARVLLFASLAVWAVFAVGARV